jgi:hypothetical protein
MLSGYSENVVPNNHARQPQKEPQNHTGVCSLLLPNNLSQNTNKQSVGDSINSALHATHRFVRRFTNSAIKAILSLVDPMRNLPNYEGESKIIRNVATYCAVGYTAGWA